MKTLIACFLLSVVGFSYATTYTYPYYNRFGRYTYKDLALLESLASLQEDQVSEAQGNDEEENLADAQGLFNVLAQVEIEQAKAMDDKSGMAQFWKQFGKTLFKAGKGYLKNRYCTEEQEMKTMLQELTGEQAIQEDNEVTAEGDDNALAELQSVFSALNKVEAKMMQGEETENKATEEGWFKKRFKKLRKSLKKAGKKLLKSYLC